MIKARIVKGNGKTFDAFDGNQHYVLSLKGKFKLNKNTVSVGDYVDISDNKQVIDKVYPRSSCLSRPRIANVDELLIVDSLVEPDFDLSLVLKYLTYANMNNIKASLILTKIDKTHSVNTNEIIEMMKKINVNTFLVNNKTRDGIDLLEKEIGNKTIALVGQSGVGKSKLLNNINPNYQRNVGEYSAKMGRGKHMTTETILLPYENGYIADTPGFSDIELNLTKQNLAKFYPGCYLLNAKCYFSNCLHQNENKCAIKDAVESGDIPIHIYEEYVKLLKEVPDSFRRN